MYLDPDVICMVIKSKDFKGTRLHNAMIELTLLIDEKRWSVSLSSDMHEKSQYFHILKSTDAQRPRSGGEL